MEHAACCDGQGTLGRLDEAQLTPTNRAVRFRGESALEHAYSVAVECIGFNSLISPSDVISKKFLRFVWWEKTTYLPCPLCRAISSACARLSVAHSHIVSPFRTVIRSTGGIIESSTQAG